MSVYFTWAGVAQLTSWLASFTAPAAKYINWGTGATAARTDTALTGEATESRITGTCSQVTTTQTNDTFQCQGTQTCNATGKTITDAGLFFVASGTGLFMEGDLTGIPVVQNDQIQFTFQLQFT